MQKAFFCVALAAAMSFTAPALAKSRSLCEQLPSHDLLTKVLKDARQQDNGGLNLDMWATVVDRSGTVCNVTFTGKSVDSQWPGSRVISAQKANTANAFSLPQLSISTANLYSAVQPGGSLFGLQASNPVDTEVAYDGDANRFGSTRDPMVGERIGGVNVFGGGLALYNEKGEIIGALGVSGDTSCADHNIAWRLRHDLALDYVPAGVSEDKNDNIVYDLANGKSAGGFGHPSCGGKETDIAATLPATRKVSAAD